MKKIISIALAAAMSFSMAASVSAADNSPAVYVNDARISFEDQNAVIVDGRTLVPARGVFEAMGASVEWDGETRTVRIYSEDNLTRVFLTIDSAQMDVYVFNNIYKADKTEVTLDVAAQIMNDRTMIPLRAISEAMNCKVEWDENAYAAYIETEDYTPYSPAEENAQGEKAKPVMSLSTETEKVSAGDTVEILVNVANVPENSYMSGVTTLVSYSKKDFEYVGTELCIGENVEEGTSLGADNPDYHDDAVKTVAITLDDSMKEDGVIAKLTFKALTSEGGSFAIKNSYDTTRGYDNSFTVTDIETNDVYEVYGTALDIDTTPVVISGN